MRETEDTRSTVLLRERKIYSSYTFVIVTYIFDLLIRLLLSVSPVFLDVHITLILPHLHYVSLFNKIHRTRVCKTKV